jgi:oxygen-independent coproporphyrinogen-3 oxidase
LAAVFQENMIFENIYIHIPFCSKKCSYCSFFSLPSPKRVQIEEYLVRLEEDLSEANLTLPSQTVYIGGGTPSLLSPTELVKLFDLIKKYVPVTPDTEISMECNPESLDAEKIDTALDFVNRLSVGIQTFHSGHRGWLGREAENQEIEHVLQCMKGHHPITLNLDLIYGIPGQTLEDWQEELKTALSHNLSHLSCYCLTIEHGTELAEKLQHHEKVDDELTATMWEDTGKILAERQMQRYEISNYCIPGLECRHNMNVWYGQPYLGLGPAATSFDGKNRWTQPQSLEQWLNKCPPEMDILDPEYRMMEIFIIGLRTVPGWTREIWEKVYLQRILPVEWQNMLTRAEKVKQRHKELISVQPDSIRLTEKGLLFWNSVAEVWLE